MLSLIVLIAVLAAIAPALAVIALVRTGQLRAFERRLSALEAELARGRHEPKLASPPVAASTEPRPTVPAVAAARPAPSPPIARVEAHRAIDWERWIGIRGAAIAGALFLGLAGFYLFRYTIQYGLITPLMRVVLGTLAGVGCLAGAHALRPRGYTYTAEAVSGAGVTLLYASIWAAHMRYELLGAVPAYLLLILVTLACGWLSVRYGSLLVAVLGLMGGFATPLMLSSGSDHPFGLFGYALLLDLGLFVVARRRGWPILGLLGLAGTVVLEAVWIFGHMGPDREWVGLVVLGVFALLFALASRLLPEASSRSVTFATQLAGVLFPFAFALYFAGRAELGARLWPIALLMALLGAAASLLARDADSLPLALGAAAASVAVTGAWVIQHAPAGALSWELAAVSVSLAALYHGFCERDPRSEGGRSMPALIVTGGMFGVILIAAAKTAVAPWAWLAAWTALAALLYRQASLTGRASLRPAAALAFAVGLTLLHAAHAGKPYFVTTPILLLLLVAAPLAAWFVALGVREDRQESLADEATIGLASALLLGVSIAPLAGELSPWAVLGTLLLVGSIGFAAATRCGSGLAYAIPAAALWLAQNVWIARASLSHPSTARAALMCGLLTVGLVTLWPFAVRARFSRDRIAWYAAALAGPLWFPALRRLFEDSFGDAAIGVLPLGLGALALFGVLLARRSWPPGEPLQRVAFVWFGAVALSFAALAVPLQLDREWITIGWALQGAAILVLWRRIDHPGLKYFALALFAAATVRLVLNPALLIYYPRPQTRIVNWLLYTYLVPAAALLCGAKLLVGCEADRARSWEEPLYRARHAVGAIASGMAAIAVIFVWINLAIADWFATGPALTLTSGQRPSQRLSVSIAWALYALVLLGFGMARSAPGLRWVSLGLLLITLIKVFLYDLGSLRDLYLVGALSGLALSLILVSLLYQRFVFRVRGAERA